MLKWGRATKRLPAYAGVAMALMMAGVWPARAQEQLEAPRSYGEPSKVDTPILRVPRLNKVPKIDGIIEPGEWDDASSLSAFRYDSDNGIFSFLAPHQTQVKVYAGFDREYLYFCQISPVYPEGSWLKARGRFKDTLAHPLYGILNDDHTELEIRPVEDLKLGHKLGLLRWDVNPIGTICDWHYTTGGGGGFQYTSGADIRSVADDKTWVIEYRIPLTALRFDVYGGNDEGGQPLVPIPPLDGTAYRFWYTRGIGGNGPFFNNFDDTDWETIMTKVIFDSKSPVIQITDMGRIMDNQIDLRLSLKNHNTTSESVRIGFHVESAEAQIYSSYHSEETPDGLVELRPGETRNLRLRSPNPKMTLDGNVLWFDVRSAGTPGTPAKTLFRTRLIKFHLMDGGIATSSRLSFRQRRLDVIETLRPKRIPFFDFKVEVNPYTKRLTAILDRGLVGVKPEVKTAVEAQLIVKNIVEGEETEVHEFRAPVIGDFAMFDVMANNLRPGEVYSVTALMYDQNMKIVGEQTETEPFTKLNSGIRAETTATKGDKFDVLPEIEASPEARPRTTFVQEKAAPAFERTDSFQVAPWMNNKEGLMDEVWEPFIPIRVTENGFETLKHRFTLDASGLPAQIEIRPDVRELPLELRAGGKVPADVLRTLGRGEQFRAPMRLEAVVDGKRVAAVVATPAKAVRTGKSEIEYASALKIGPLAAELKIRYDCDGSFQVSLLYGDDTPVKVDRLELVADIAGIVDLAVSNSRGFTDTGSDRGECGLPNKPGVVWDSTLTQMELFYTRFVPSFWFGSADRGWSYFANSTRGWILDRDGSTMQLERNKNGDVTWRVAFVNHPAEVKGKRAIDFAILTHPAKPKPENFRQHAWHYTVGKMWALMEIHATANWGDSTEIYTYLVDDARMVNWWHDAAGAPTQLPNGQRTVWRNDMPPYIRYGFANGAGCMNLPYMDRLFEDKGTFYMGRLISFGRRMGWWMNDYRPTTESHNMAMGDAYQRPVAEIGKDELPWQPGFLAFQMRNLYKRLARVQAVENVPPRQQAKANDAGRLLESYLWNTVMMRGVGTEVGSYDVDLILRYPNSLYRAMAMNYAGVITTLAPDKCPVGPGDDPRFERQKLGLALLHDFGITRNASHVLFRGGPGGNFQDLDQALRLLRRLTQFGFFRDDDVEKLPFWRNDALVRMGDKPNDESKVRVTVYRRPLDNGKGYQAIFVILNESDGDIELPLNILDSQRILGGANNLPGGNVAVLKKTPEILKDVWNPDAGVAATPALRDFETDEMILRVGDKAGQYGPVFVPYHDYRILYGECRP